MSKSARVVHDFMVKKHLPSVFSIWGLVSLLIACGLSVVFLQRALTVASETGAGYFAALFLAPFLYMLAKILAKPTHLEVSKRGLRNSWRRTINFNGEALNWVDVERIAVIQPGNTSRAQSRLLSFQGKGRTVDLKVDEVTEIAMLPALYNAILQYAPHVPRDPEVQAILGSDKANSSYTELWLKALTAPPDRSRLAPLLPGTSLQDGEYTILERIGAGGQGVAYTASSRSTDDHPVVVLKEYVLPVGVSHASKVDSLEKFQREAQILSQISHPQIVKLLDFFFEDHRGYTAMEYVPGQNLSALVGERGVLPESEVLELAMQMATILEYLHSRNPAVIHRDFTPDNLILTAGGVLKLIDFNVAQQQKNTATATVVGKHAYISPDQFRGQVTPQNDIYSMGATIFFLLTGVEPKPISVSHARLKNPSVSKELDAVVARCTAVETEERFTSAAELNESLRALQSSSTATIPEVAKSNSQH